MRVRHQSPPRRRRSRRASSVSAVGHSRVHISQRQYVSLRPYRDFVITTSATRSSTPKGSQAQGFALPPISPRRSVMPL